MSVGLYILTSETLPRLDNERHHILIQLEDDKDCGPSAKEERTIDDNQYSCVTTLVTNCPDDDDFRAEVVEWWEEMADVKPKIELLTNDQSLMSADQRASIARLQPDSWSIRTPLVLYRRGCSEGRGRGPKICGGIG